MALLSEHFVLPQALWALPLAPLWWVFLRGLDRRRQRVTGTWLGPRTVRLAAEAGGAGRRAAQRLLLATGLLAALVAVAQPRFGTPRARTADRGLDLVLCLDVSRSMLATDVQPSRLRRAQAEIEALATAAAGDRVGLVLFAGSARFRVPLTRDLHSLALLAAAAGPRSVELGGTDLGMALQTAVAALESGRATEAPTSVDGTGRDTTDTAGTAATTDLPDTDLAGAAIVLLTDGEDRDQLGLRAARACQQRGASVHCIGFGTPLGSKIPIVRDGRESFLRDRDGQEVITRLESASLQRIAAAGGGAWLALDGGSGRPLTDLYRARIRPTARASWRQRAGTELPNRYQLPLGLAALCSLLALGLDLRRRTA